MDVCNTHDWAQLIRISSRKNPYVVHELEIGDIFSFDFLGDTRNSPLIQRKKDCANNDFLISHVVYLQFKKDFPGIVYFKEKFDDNEFQQINLIRQKRQPLLLPESIPLQSKNPIPISTKKYQHLQDLLQRIPESLKEYYRNLPHGKENEEDE
ncbi:hypothetical protein RI129_004578 [Pyrocoelia pectoralis]|uniref:Uncharacterized protein n=1 Tax=Pyrocoelia pectoralis TaxID=417401 RepID=A0AAN7VLT1_9COLE